MVRAAKKLLSAARQHTVKAAQEETNNNRLAVAAGAQQVRLMDWCVCETCSLQSGRPCQHRWADTSGIWSPVRSFVHYAGSRLCCAGRTRS